MSECSCTARFLCTEHAVQMQEDLRLKFLIQDEMKKKEEDNG